MGHWTQVLFIIKGINYNMYSDIGPSYLIVSILMITEVVVQTSLINRNIYLYTYF